ncbi:nuclear transport factor 2 family protein [Rhizobium leguminosarum bv. trifolii]|nr:nuclear transport factor 2 family protein [Rhizobium leguminosarum bv. trifolii]
MTIELPKPLATYFAAKNRKDINSMLSTFGEDADVRDEGEDMHGHAAIRGWMEKTTRKYGVNVEVTGLAGTEAQPIVSALVAGNFPGSPATLQYHFSLDNQSIIHLEIGA